MVSLITRFMGPTWGPSGTDRTQVVPMLAPWTLLVGLVQSWDAKVTTPSLKCGMKLLIHCNHTSLEMNQQLHPTSSRACCLSMLELKLIHAYKSGRANILKVILTSKMISVYGIRGVAVPHILDISIYIRFISHNFIPIRSYGTVVLIKFLPYSGATAQTRSVLYWYK